MPDVDDDAKSRPVAGRVKRFLRGAPGRFTPCGMLRALPRQDRQQDKHNSANALTTGHATRPDSAVGLVTSVAGRRATKAEPMKDMTSAPV